MALLKVALWSAKFSPRGLDVVKEAAVAAIFWAEAAGFSAAPGGLKLTAWMTAIAAAGQVIYHYCIGTSGQRSVWRPDDQRTEAKSN
jgi:hypothetical protein